MPDLFGGDHAHTVANGIRCVKMDPITILTVMGMATERLGLGSTFSTTYFEPFHVARVFATLDLMTEGRAAWNVVTSMNDGEAHNMGHAAHGEHDARYDRADEFMEVVMGHWDAWEDDAIVADRATGLFAHPDKVHRLDYKGEYFQSRGPFTVPRSAQGHPVIIQAGQSGRGHPFAALWAECVFVAYHGSVRRSAITRTSRPRSTAAGRDPEKTFVCAGVYPIVAETRAEAEDKVALIDNLPKEIDSLSLLSEVLNFDFSQQPIDKPFTQEAARQLDRRAGHPRPHEARAWRSAAFAAGLHQYHPPRAHSTTIRVSLAVQRTSPTAGGMVFNSGLRRVRGRVRRTSPAPMRIFPASSSLNCNAAAYSTTDYTGTTLRENLGLDRPSVGDWR